MEELSRDQISRASIRGFKVVSDALLLRGYYKPCGASGKPLEQALRTISPEIYELINDSHRIELDGLIYVIDRLPRGIEQCSRITLSTAEGLANGFPKIYPLKRRRTSYRVSEKEMCFEITTGRSEIYDLLTHLTFLYIEGKKIKNHGYIESEPTQEWLQLEKMVHQQKFVQSCDQEIWNLSKILGRTFHETKNAYLRLQINKDAANDGIFNIVYWLGKRMWEAEQAKENEHLVIFTPSLMFDYHKYGKLWAVNIKQFLEKQNLKGRETHIVSANMHSVLNLCYGFALVSKQSEGKEGLNAREEKHIDIYQMAHSLRQHGDAVKAYAEKHGCIHMVDESGTHINCQIIDTAQIDIADIHPDVRVDRAYIEAAKPIILVMDYAFGEQAFEVMDELLKPNPNWDFKVKSISIMGKAGILEGDKGDIMLPTAHVFEGVTDTYPCPNQFQAEDFKELPVYRGSMVTVLGTSLQNKDVLTYFLKSSWKAIGLEMEGGQYQKAIQAAIVRGHIPTNVVLRYAYYASDNPLKSGQTLASGGMGEEGIKPTYLITKAILEKVLNPSKS